MNSSPASPDPGGSTQDPSHAFDKVEQEFVALWRNMSALWGISPTMAQIHGLLFISGEVLSMDDLMARLEISRGNVSMNLTKLVEWGLVRRVHRRGDRREYYQALTDVWEMFTLVAAQRKRREIDPMLNTLRQCASQLSVESLETPVPADAVTGRRRRVEDLLSFLALVDTLAQRFFENNKSLRTAMDLLARKEGDEPASR